MKEFSEKFHKLGMFDELDTVDALDDDVDKEDGDNIVLKTDKVKQAFAEKRLAEYAKALESSPPKDSESDSDSDSSDSDSDSDSGDE